MSINVTPFTGPDVGSPWWNPTDAVFVWGKSGIVVYGEIQTSLVKGQEIQRGDLVGRVKRVKRVLKNDKGLPTSMLHLELREPRCLEAFELFDWALDAPQPGWLLDPTPHLLKVTP
jgi:hypothetical protein